MATESTETVTNTDSTEETSDQAVEQQDTEQSTTPETGGNGGSQESSTDQDESKLPDDHPLVKTLAAQKAELKELRTEASRVKDLESKVADLQTKADSVAEVQGKYDRLEQFLQGLGGPVSKILDSRSFSQRLFESDDKIDDIIKDWHKANPSATSQALGGGSAPEPGKKTSMNDLIRAAAGK